MDDQASYNETNETEVIVDELLEKFILLTYKENKD